MPFVPINTSEIATGEPVSSTTQSKIAGNFDNHESRILAVETGSTTVYSPIILSVYGPYGFRNGALGLLRTTLNFNLTITGIRLIVDEIGSGGTTEIDIRYKRGSGAWTSILTTRPSLTSAAGANAVSTNTVLNLSEVNLQAGDLVRLDITAVQTGNPKGFLARIDFNKS